MFDFDFDKVILIKNEDGTISCECYKEGKDDNEYEIVLSFPNVVPQIEVLKDKDESYGTYKVNEKGENK